MTACGRGDFAAATDNCTEHVGWGSHFRRMHTEEVHGMEAEAPVPFRPVLLSQPGSRSAPNPHRYPSCQGEYMHYDRALQISACKRIALGKNRETHAWHCFRRQGSWS